MLRKNFFGGGGVAFLGGLRYTLDNGNSCIFLVAAYILIIKRYVNILS
ncbi:conserved protein of unknown function [Limnospira indica PCC 8005]|uniref:Uncharacterized protein n=1 Tax=Limnospira indica PCC 8005 TaxID=376219 RepID=A0A9P1NYR3_9CYAN|nr:conserved protein of unknown function [Limnospira indica PCC 8005]